MQSLRLPILALLTVFTSGCAVGPDHVRPEIAMPAVYMGTSGPKYETCRADGTPSADLETWWSAFGDPQLTRYVHLALQQNLELSQASARMAQARAGLQAAGAALRPSGGAMAQAARAHQSVETPLGRVLDSVPGYDRNGSAYEANLSAGWELDLFGGLRRAQEASRFEYEGSEAAAVAVRLAVAAQTADTYITVRGLQARIDVAERQVRTQQKLLATVDLRFQKGLSAELQLRQAEGALVRAKAAVPVMQAALDTAMNALDVMLGTSPGTHRAELAEMRPVPALQQIASSGSPGELLRRRPDLIAAERMLGAHNARIGVAIAEYYPKISLTGLLGSATSISSGNLFTGGAAQAGASLGLRWRLFDFGRVDAQIRYAEAREAEALGAYRQAVLRATEEVENALSAFDRRQEQSSLLSSGVGSLTRAREASGAAFDKGVVSLIEVLQADESLLSVLDAQVQARTESARSAIAIFKALGGGWTPDPAAVAVRKSNDEPVLSVPTGHPAVWIATTGGASPLAASTAFRP